MFGYHCQLYARAVFADNYMRAENYVRMACFLSLKIICAWHFLSLKIVCARHVSLPL